MSELGFRTPTRWDLVVVEAAALGVVLKLVVKSLVMPLAGAPPVNEPFQYLAGNAAALPAWRGQLWTPIIAHVAFNLTGVVLIYASWEEAVARAVIG